MYENILREINPLLRINSIEDSQSFFDLIRTKKSRKYLLKLDLLGLDILSKYIADFYQGVRDSFCNLLKNNDQILFGYYFSDINGQTKAHKVKRLCDYAFIYKKLLGLYQSLKDTHCINELGKNYAHELKNGRKLLNGKTLNITSDNYPIKYVSYYGQGIIEDKVIKEQRYLSSVSLRDLTTGQVMVDKDGNIVTLKELSKDQKTVKLNQLYFAQKSLEAIAEQKGFTFLFITLTLPPNFKPAPLNGNISYDRENAVKDGINFLNDIWRYFQSCLNHLKKKKYGSLPSLLKGKTIKAVPFGFSCKEPQKDGTPHSHFLFYCHKEDKALFAELWNYCCKTIFETHDQNFSEHCSIKIIFENENLDGKKSAKPSTYIFKYIMKTLGVSSYECNKNKKTTHTVKIDKQEVDASMLSYRLHRYRRYSFFGVDTAFAKWKELKRLTLDKELLKAAQTKIKNNCEQSIQDAFNKIVIAVNGNNYLEFIKLLKTSPVELDYKYSINKYQELVKTVKGLKVIYYENDVKKEIKLKSRKEWEIIKI